MASLAPVTDHAHGADTLAALSPQTKALRALIPEVYSGFAQLAGAAYADGALPKKFKELVALAIGVVEQCDGCIASHAKGAVRAGATREEAAELIGVVIAMRGGPATVHGPRAFDVFCEFADAAAAKAD